MSDHARLPQPREGEPLAERCCWCGAGRSIWALGDFHTGQTVGVTFQCESTDGVTHEAFPNRWKRIVEDRPSRPHGLCTRTPADLAAVCMDVVAELERRLSIRVCGLNGCRIPDGVIQCGRCGGLAAYSIERDETDTERLRRVLLDSLTPEPETEAARIVAGLLRDVRAIVHAAP